MKRAVLDLCRIGVTTFPKFRHGIFLLLPSAYSAYLIGLGLPKRGEGGCQRYVHECSVLSALPTVRVNWQTRDTNMISCTFGIKETTSKLRCLLLATYSAVRCHTRYPTNSRIDTLQSYRSRLFRPTARPTRRGRSKIDL